MTDVIPLIGALEDDGDMRKSVHAAPPTHRFYPFAFGEEFLGLGDPGRPGRFVLDFAPKRD